MGACVSRAVSDPARRAAGRARSDAAAVLLWAAVRYQNRTLEKRNGERPAGPPSAVRVRVAINATRGAVMHKLVRTTNTAYEQISTSNCPGVFYKYTLYTNTHVDANYHSITYASGGVR